MFIWHALKNTDLFNQVFSLKYEGSSKGAAKDLVLKAGNIMLLNIKNNVNEQSENNLTISIHYVTCD